ncbi:MAG: cytochrome c oxidase subunit 3 [Novosphingobium sp.]|uniref:cytochrome c oxidase subunit 3 n=1 Tax=Novosphingobium sp. TaxID=1874826 RepID=UPI002735E830|nr:cytochrome c oxidase subunit 3 [Novosphingobium sp.]MDP3552247.1 cytochrome c oxidase subunit 3 [Novosphingobium sp.]
MNEAEEAATPHHGHIPGEPGLWVLIFGDLLVFGVLFVTYAHSFVAEADAMRLSQEKLGRGLGLANTILLLTSSWAIAHAVNAARHGSTKARQLILGAIALGVAFVGVKIVEWGGHISHGDTLNSSSFFTFYFMYTGIHLLHVLIGLGVLTWLASQCDRSGAWTGSFAVLEGSAVFWHLVDLLWVMLFALLYLLRHGAST